ncbi:TetR/AcrR family transcriptional regulator [Pseudobacillus badius]|uniref:TetR/AcrR family transcriptional regulator n=1 Tax=Bacillus badius TaxID=1455 RepID=UPI0024A0D46D|nr:TetR/AcrR family transcriptional regulator [Bacillus badius]GLY10687.1 TetR family transcriptional regulator [Bacillus badius]
MNSRKRQVMVAAHALFVEKGYAATSIQDILDASHISKGTFYNYFSSKSELLINILEDIKTETKKQRLAVLSGRQASDRIGFSDQLVITMEVNKRNNLFILFQGVFASEEEELKQLVKRHYLEELKWIQSRIIELYGKKVKPYSLDLSLIFLGSVQQMIQLFMVTKSESIELKEIIAYGLRRMDGTIADVQSSEDILVGEWFFDKCFPEIALSKEHKRKNILERINVMQQGASPKQKELLGFLQNEIKVTKPRAAVIEAVLGVIDGREDLADLVIDYLHE